MKFRLWLMLVMVIALPGGAMAQLGVLDTGRDAGKPVDITADDLTIKSKEQLAVFKGNVEAKQGSFTLRADQMDVHYHEGAKADAVSPNALSKIVAKGGVVLTLPDRQAKSDLGVYDVDASRMELTGHVVLIKDNNRLQGSRFVYDVASGTSKLLSDSEKDASSTAGSPVGEVKKDASGRVKGFFVPKQKTPAAPQ